MPQRVHDALGAQRRGPGEDDDEEDRRDGGKQSTDAAGKHHPDEDRGRDDEGHEGRQPAVELLRCHSSRSSLHARHTDGQRQNAVAVILLPAVR